ncbi:hypothetical protein [Actinoplanes sp. NPDC089786]|uniref:hypothetical protein n=1 Tax=Actinoplanes sp. NPDC089786 TaxID=3155185 RepID=UPI00342F96AE
MGRLWGAAGSLLLLATAGCAAQPSQARPAPSASPAALRLTTIRDCPPLAGPDREPGPDDPVIQPGTKQTGLGYQRFCVYGNPVTVSVTIDVYVVANTGPYLDVPKSVREAKSYGHFAVPVSGAGDRALAIADGKDSDGPRPLVLTMIAAGNVELSIQSHVTGAVRGDADLRAHAPELAALGAELIRGLGP